MISHLKSIIKKVFKARDHGLKESDTTTYTSCKIEKNVKVGRYSYLNNVSIDSYSYLAGFNTMMNTKIGKFCSIAENVKIGLGIHPVSSFVSTSPVFYSPSAQCGFTFADKSYFTETGIVNIGNDVWIGANAVLMDNVTIGDGAIIAAGAVVTKDVAPYSITGGVPAKHIKYRFDDIIIKALLESRWWDFDKEYIRAHFKEFHDAASFAAFIKK